MALVSDAQIDLSRGDIASGSDSRALIYRNEIPNDGENPLTPSQILNRHGITFNIWYLDEFFPHTPPIGFAHNVLGATRQARFEEALAYIALLLNEQGDLDVVVRESANDGPGGEMGDRLAEAGTWHAALDYWQNGVAYERLALDLAKPFGPFVDDLHIRVDFGFSWNNRVAQPDISDYDLLSVLVHEIMHGLGIASAAGVDGASLLDIDEDGNPDGGYTWWDYFITDSAGAPLFDCCSPEPIFLGPSADWTSGNIYWSGPEALAAYAPGGLGPKLTGPEIGETPSHWSESAVPGTVMSTERLPSIIRRSLSAFEIGALRDIGWTNASVPGASFLGSIDVGPDGERTAALALGDVNNDGAPDLIAGNDGAADLLYLNNGTSNPFAGVTGLAVGTSSESTTALALGDVNNDGYLDLVRGRGNGLYGAPNRLLINNGTADPFGGVDGTQIGIEWYPTVSMALGDVDRDGLLDLVTGNTYGNPDHLFINNGTPDAFATATLALEPNSTVSVELADVNRDGWLDLIVGAKRLYINQAPQTQDYFTDATMTVIATNSQDALYLEVGDMNGDGYLDIVALNRNRTNNLYLNNHDRDSPFAFDDWLEIGSEVENTGVGALADIDGDGYLDVVVGNSRQRNAYYLNNRTPDPFAGVSATYLDTFTRETQDIALGDVDQDGDIDIIEANARYFENGANQIYMNASIPNLSFPLENRTPYTAVITSVFDHSLITPYSETGRVVAFTGEIGDNEIDETADGIDGYSNPNGSPFNLTGHYAYGTSDPYLYYDAHPAIDYRTTDQLTNGRIPVLAAASGQASRGSSEWGVVVIDHGDGFSTEYWHLSQRFPPSEGSINVARGEQIGISGDIGPGIAGAPHLHFELKYNGVSIDPYGWQGTPGEDPYSYPSGIQDHNYWGSISEAWVNSNISIEPGNKLGTDAAPYTLVAEAQSHVESGGTIYISSGSYDETLHIEKPMRLEAVDGTVTIGAP